MKNKGFSLVELIVVIAIMAILVGVAVPVYSSYIEKTQKAKDKQLVGEITHALQVGYAAEGGSSAPAYVILYPNKGAEANEAAQTLLADIFPDLDDLQLAYDGWGDATSLSFLNALNETSAKSIIQSSYLQNSSVNELLGEVSDLTGTAFNFLTKYFSDPAVLYEKMRNNFMGGADKDAEFIALCERYGIAVKNVSAVEGEVKYSFDDSDPDLQTKLSNFMVMAAANDFSQAADPNRPADYQPTEAATLVLQLASVNAFVANSKDPAIKSAYNDMVASLANETTVGGVQGKIAAFGDSYPGFETYLNSDQAGTDGSAIMNIMATVGNAADSVTADDMKSPTLYHSGAVADYFDSYVSAAGLVAGLGDELVSELKAALTANPNAIAVYMVDGQVKCTNVNVYSE